MYLFFVRHFNDIDHTVPVVWKMHKENYPVAVYCMNPRYDISEDYRLRFLQQLGVTVNYLHNEFDQNRGRLHKLLSTLTHASYGREKRLASLKPGTADASSRLLITFFALLGTLFYKITRLLYYNKTWAHSILVQTGAQAICFDYVMPRRYVVSSFLKAAREMCIPTVSLPHGVMLYTNKNSKPKSTRRRRRAKFARFDYILVPNRLRKELLLEAGIPENKIFVLGSARYCKEWLQQNSRILPRSLGAAQSDSGKLKVVFMQSKPQCRIDLQRMATTFDVLAHLADIQTMVKPHTRSGDHNRQLDESHLLDASTILTAELCEWADVLLVVGSSVVTEALMQGKPALYLKYLHKNTTLFEELGACWLITDEVELQRALRKLHKDKQDLPYGEKNVAAYLKEVVYGGSSNKDVLGSYLQFIVACGSRPRQKVITPASVCAGKRQAG
ncbi:MAG: hypothetical protein JRJ12_08655 [Deltaproteobacteria bacterium]|nr:hypothetical protein [Deltaproteobacteria bacterium]MBW2069622.1 hypothetical protein [Deltaproteobacteria bacterium]